MGQICGRAQLFISRWGGKSAALVSPHTAESVSFVSRFPVILSIENHCSIQQQKKIAQYLKEIFGDKLDLSSVSTGDPRQLPSPQDLKGKILVKVTCCWACSECNRSQLVIFIVGFSFGGPVHIPLASKHYLTVLPWTECFGVIEK